MEPYIDQIPNLADLRRYLEHLSLSDPPMAQGVFVLEQVCARMRTWLRVHARLCVCVFKFYIFLMNCGWKTNSQLTMWGTCALLLGARGV